MEIDAVAKPGQFMCMYKPFQQNSWLYSCTTTYQGCVNRAHSLRTQSKGACIMIVEVIVLATPSFELVWETTLIDKITKE